MMMMMITININNEVMNNVGIFNTDDAVNNNTIINEEDNDDYY